MKTLIKSITLICLTLFLLVNNVYASSVSPYTFSSHSDSINISERFKGQDEKMVVLIQDAHTDVKVQHSIADLIRALVDSDKIDSLFLEGSSGNVDMSEYPLSELPSLKKLVAEKFVNQGRLSGAEAGIISAKKECIVKGAEDWNLFEQSVRSRYEAAAENHQVNEHCENILFAINDLKKVVYKNKLYDLSRCEDEYKNEKVSFNSFMEKVITLSYQTELDMTAYPNIYKLIDYLQVYSQFREENAAQQFPVLKEKVLDVASVEIEYTQTDHIIYLYNLLKSRQIDLLCYRDFCAKAKSLCIYKTIKFLNVKDELDDMLNDLKLQLAETKVEKELIRIEKFVDDASRILSFKVTREEFLKFTEEFHDMTFQKVNYKLASIFKTSARYYRLTGSAKKQDRVFRLVSEFYKSALKRDEAMVECMIDSMNTDGSNCSAIVVGGFHSNGIAEVLRARGVSYVVCSPAEFSAPESADLPYRSFLPIQNINPALISTVTSLKSHFSEFRQSTAQDFKTSLNSVVSELYN